jgi:hypothetical protein
MAKEAGYISETDSEAEQPESKSSLEVNPDDPEPDELLCDLLIEFSPDDATKATLDMIVVLVGEVFRQRDLLESRAIIDWPV